MTRSKRKLSASPIPFQQQLPFTHEGRFFDLKAIFDKLNARFFHNALRGYRIMWGRRRKQPPKRYFVFGTIHEDLKLIRIHPRLDASFVPQWFLEYVVYHEMLHAVVPEQLSPSGRRRIHTPEFLRREEAFPGYRRARRWETQNLARLLR